jgi:DNA-binding transcriptional ArsR family regulator
MSAMVTTEIGPSIVPTLSRDLCRRLAQIEFERHAIRRALIALEGSTRARIRRVSATVVLEAVRKDPGVRGTMLALKLEVAPEVVNLHLQELENSGLVEKSRLGWRPGPGS